MKKLSLGLLFLILSSCASTTPSVQQGPGPEWIRQPTRIVDNSYIVYIGSGEDTDHDRAQYKAEGAALADLANECSFVPKGARLEDRFEKVESRLHEAYAKVGVEFQVCEEAKKTIQPDDVRKLASEPMAAKVLIKWWPRLSNSMARPLRFKEMFLRVPT